MQSHCASSVMYTHNSSGYEPNARSALSVNPAPRNVGQYRKILDNQFKILPDWKWEDPGRTQFIDTFRRLIRATSTVWLLKNHKAENPALQSGGNTTSEPVDGIFFTPRRSLRPGQQRRGTSPQVTTPLRVAGRAPPRAQVAAPYRAVGGTPLGAMAWGSGFYPGPGALSQTSQQSNTGAYGQLGHRTHEASTFLSSPVTSLAMPEAAGHLVPRAQGLQPVREGRFEDPPSSPESVASVSRAQPEHAHLQRGAWEIPSPDSHTDDERHASEEQTERREEQPGPRQGEPSVAEHGDMFERLRATMMEQFEREQQRRDTVRERERREQEGARAQHERMQSQHIQTLSAQLAQLTNGMQQQQLHGANMASDTLISVAQDDWVIDADIDYHFAEQYVWYCPMTGVQEDTDQGMIRARFWTYFVTVLPPTIWGDVDELDIRELYDRMLRTDRADVSEQVDALRHALYNFTKGRKSMRTWLTELYNKLDELAKLRSPVESEFVRRLIKRSLKDDKIYQDLLRDMRRNPQWDIPVLRIHLEEAARLGNDLVNTEPRLVVVNGRPIDGDVKKVSKRAAKRAARQAAKVAKAVAGPDKTGGTENEGKTQQVGFPSSRPASTPAAEGDSVDLEKRKQLSKELCRNFMLGSCRYGDGCWRSHVSFAELQKQDSNTNGPTPASSPRPPGGPPGNNKAHSGNPKDGSTAEPSMGPCFQFTTNGACSFGDRCKFEHPTPSGNKMHRARATNMFEPKRGDLVQLAQNLIVPGLRGALGQVIGPGLDGRHRIQIICDSDQQSCTTLVGQLIHMAAEVGMADHEFFIVPVEKRGQTLHTAKAYRAHAAKATSAYSANAIFDTGASDVFSGPHARGIFAYLTRLDTPLKCAGSNGHMSQYTHTGPVTLVTGTTQREVTGYYSESEDTTVVPGQQYDDCEYWNASRDRSLHLYKGDEHLASFPRDIAVDPGQAHSKPFLESLGARQHDGTRRHILYPLPDTFFVWHDGHANKVHKTASGSAPEARPTLVEESKAVGLDDYLSPRNDAIDTWANTISPAGPRAKAILHALKELHGFHHRLGHRSHEHTVRQYEWVVGRPVPAEVTENARPCNSCDKNKITSKPYEQRAMLTPTRAGEEVAADTIVSLPRSHGGYRHGAHIYCVATNYGAFWPLKTKSCAQLGIFWLKHLHNHLGVPVARFKCDSGEWLTTELVSYCESVGTTVVPSLADTHANQGIERRHRTLEECSGALLTQGGAAGHMWEYSYPTANHILNLTIQIAKLRKAGRPTKGRERPLTPFEMLENHGKPCNIKKLWGALHHLFGHGVGYKEARGSHDERGENIIYLGPIPMAGGVDMHCHLGLRSDHTVHKYRTVRTTASYPWLAKPGKALGRAAPEGASISAASTVAAPVSGATPALANASGGDLAEPVSDRVDKLVDKYAPGTRVMTTNGPCVVIARYDQSDLYCVRFDNDHEPEAAWTIRRSQMWLSEDYPGWDYDVTGTHVGTLPVPAVAKPIPLLRALTPLEDLVIDDIDPPESKHEPQGIASRTRSRAKVARAVLTEPSRVQYRTFDPGGQERIMHHPPARAYKLKPKVPAPVPEGTPLSLTTEELECMPAVDVERILPQHQHQTFGHPMRHACASGEVKELQNCLNRGVWGAPIPIEPGMIVIGLMWVYAIKVMLETGMYKSTRARITLMGNQERLNALIGALEAYAPVALMITGRLLIATHLHIKGIIIRQLDVANAYINENMKRKVLCRLPPGYTVEWLDQEAGTFTFRRLRPGEKAPRLALPLIKALYGGMECGRIFWEAWLTWHLDDGFQIIHEERCYLCKRSVEGHFVKLGFHVDDNLIVALGEAFYQAYLERLAAKFDVTEGPLEEHLGVLYSLDLEAQTCSMTQPAQIKKVLSLFGHENCHSVPTPMFDGPAPCMADCDDPYEEAWDMMGFVGHMSWLHQCTRPDLGQVVKILSRYTTKFGKRHVLLAKHILRYLKGTITLGLMYRAGYPLFFQIFTDASHASCTDTRRSIVSLVAKLGGNTVYWKTSFTSIVSHSSTESELMALDGGATVSEALRWLLEAIGGPVQGTIRIFVDNHGTISIASNPVQAGRNMHIHARYFYVRDLVYGCKVEVCPIPTELQVADVGCTFKGGPSFIRLRGYLMECARIIHDTNGEPVWEVLVYTE